MLPRYGALAFARKTARSAVQRSYTCLAFETSCDDTGVAVMNSDGRILGETVHSQIRNTVRFGGVIPPIAAQFHKDSLEPALQEVLIQASKHQSGFSLNDIDFIAVTYAPGLPIALRTGIEFSKKLAIQCKKPLFPVHHMQAHALVPRLTEKYLCIDYPFLVLLISGGHSLLVFVKSPIQFLLLGHSLDDAPGEILDKTARLLKLQHIPDYSQIAAGHAVELLSTESRYGPTSFEFPHVMTGDRNCDFSFAGLKYYARKIILRQERDKGILGGNILPNAADICSSFQLSILRHFSNRLARAISYCDISELWSESQKTVVVSGGVASNQFFRSGLRIVCDSLGCQTAFPPVKYCTDNAVMIAWNALEKLKWQKMYCNIKGLADCPELLTSEDLIDNLQPINRISIGEDIREAVVRAQLRAPKVKLVF